MARNAIILIILIILITIGALISLLGNLGALGWAEEPTPAPGARAIFYSARGEKVTVNVEVADTAERIHQGLMFRRHLAADRGMLFVFPYASRQRMWMMNTFIPLDMIFINDMMRIVGVVENTQPLSSATIEVPAPSRYVVEVNAFFCRRFGIQPGDRVIIEGIQVKP